MNGAGLLSSALALAFTSACFGRIDELNKRHEVHVFHQTSLSITSLTASGGKKVVLSYAFPEHNLKEDETLLVLAELQGVHVSSQNNPLLDGHIYLGFSGTYDDTEDLAKTAITENNGQNLTPDSAYQLLHDTHFRVGTYKITAEDVTNDRRFVNVMAEVQSLDNNATVNLQQSGSKLTIVRFTPVQTPDHGWLTPPPFDDTDAPTGIQVNSIDMEAADVIYVVDLNASGTDPVKKDDIVLALAEVQAEYTGSSMVYFNTQLRRSATNSRTTSSTAADPPIGKSNRFSMKGGSITQRTAVKTAAYEYPSDSAGNTYRYIKLVAWRGVSALDGREGDPNETNGTGDAQVAVVVDPIDVGQGKLSVLRYRKAQEGQQPLGVDRLDQPEFNAPCSGLGCYSDMEQISTLPPSPDQSDAEVLFYQTLDQLTKFDILLSVSEMQGTNEYGVKNVFSRLVVSKLDDTNEFSLTKANRVQIQKSSTHHGTSPKVGVLKAPSLVGEQGDTYRVKRLIWSLEGFSGDCVPQSGCDVINDNHGRLGVLRLKPLPAGNCIADCCADIVTDGVVDVNDLLAVINGWGTCPAFPAPCPADVTDNGQVNVDDLLTVINNWGPCGHAIAGGAPQTVDDCYERTKQRYPNTSSQQFADTFEACIESLCHRGLLSNCN